MKIPHFFGSVLTAGALTLSGSFLIPAQAQTAPACGFAYDVAGLLNLGATGCQKGDKIYSNFSLTGFDPANSVFSFGNPTDLQHVFSGTNLGLTATSTATYSYTVTVADQATNLQRIKAYSTSFTGSPVAGPVNGTKILASTQVSNPTSSTANYVNDILTNGNDALFGPPGVTNYNGALSSVNFTGSINVTGGRIDQFSDSLTQAVPGPLPILGAGAAFGFSRKLRRRIKASA